MKYLYLVRHAKSSWDHPGLEDFDRPLNKRGMCDAPKMGEYLVGQRILPQIIVSSPARRAHTTAISLAAAMQVPPSGIVKDDRIYAAATATLIAVIQEWDDTWERVMMVGHNPGMADMAAVLTDAGVCHVPTCTVMGFSLDIVSWGDVVPNCGIQQFKIVPKDIL
ncbi:MAG: histidine phosphatase family protein [Mariprofundaceae bacterium]|nr:histidine phosphatase family protein [Mariprofundaceae bacterium]